MSQLDDFPGIPTGLPSENEDLGFGGRLMKRLIGRLRHGRLKVILPSGAVVEAGGSEPGPDAVIVLRRWRMLRRVLTSGDIGFAEGFCRKTGRRRT